MLAHKPVVAPKWYKSSCKLSISAAIGLINSIASSAYKLIRILIGSAPIGVSNPCYVAMSSNLWSWSIASMNSIGDSGSPCLRSRACLIGLPGSLFNIILEVVLP
jgi:hypothetical protein